MQILSSPCPLCQEANGTSIAHGLDFLLGNSDQIFEIVECQTCQHVYLNHPPEDMDIYYPNDYEIYSHRNGIVGFLQEKLDSLRARSLLNSLNQHSHVLEIGCSNGAFLNQFKINGHHTKGIEFSSHAANFAKEHYELDVDIGKIEELELEQEKYDLIIMRAVLEHLHNPRLALEKAFQALKPNGRIVLNVPNFSSIERMLFGKYWIGYDFPRHLQVFKSSVLTQLLQECHFDNIQMSYSPVPNDWCRSLAHLLLGPGSSNNHNLLSLKNPFWVVGLLPFSSLAAAFKMGGRISISAKKT